MKDLYFLDNELSHLAAGEDYFDRLREMEGEVFRKYKKRITKRFQINRKNYFIKYHGPVGWKEIFKNLLQIKTPVIGAQREYEALRHLSDNGINCPNIKGFGKKGLNPANSSSFLITEELYETLSLEDFFLRGLYKNLTRKQKIILIENVAALVRTMHKSGLNHRDLYLCHIHIKDDLDFTEPELHLIDLHRAQIRSEVPQRWIVKDLGGFFHSCFQFGFSERDFYRFMMTYYNCSFRTLISDFESILEKITSRAFRMYLKPALTELSKKTFEGSEENLHIFQNNNGKYFSDKDFDLRSVFSYLINENLLISEGEVIKNEEGHLVVRVIKGERIFYIKKYRIKNILHWITRLFKKTRAYNSCISTLWLNAAGIKTAKVLLLYEGKGILGARESFLVTEEIDGERLDDFLEKNLDYDLSSDIEAFFKKMKWIQFTHGDAKSSNFFFNHKGLVTFDLDSSSKRYSKFSFRRAVDKDKKRILRSLKNYGHLYSKLHKSLKGS